MSNPDAKARISVPYRHDFVNNFDGMVAFGLTRDIDEQSLMATLQQFTDDELLKALIPRLDDAEIEEAFNLVTRLMRNHLNDEEYHRFFLKEEGHSHHHHEKD